MSIFGGAVRCRRLKGRKKVEFYKWKKQGRTCLRFVDKTSLHFLIDAHHCGGGASFCGVQERKVQC